MLLDFYKPKTSTNFMDMFVFSPYSFSLLTTMRTYNEELKYLEKVTPRSWRIKKGFVANMNVSA